MVIEFSIERIPRQMCAICASDLYDGFNIVRRKRINGYGFKLRTSRLTERWNALLNHGIKSYGMLGRMNCSGTTSLWTESQEIL